MKTEVTEPLGRIGRRPINLSLAEPAEQEVREALAEVVPEQVSAVLEGERWGPYMFLVPFEFWHIPVPQAAEFLEKAGQKGKVPPPRFRL